MKACWIIFSERSAADESIINPRKPEIPPHGFTLLELLVVIAIIGILGALGTGGYSAAKRRAKAGRTQADLELIRNALEDFRAAYGCYPELDPADWLKNLTPDSLTALTNTASALSLEDPWGNGYWYYRAAGPENRFVYQLWSTGADVDDEVDNIR